MTKFNQPFDVDAFQSLGKRLIDVLADYLRKAQGRALPVLPVISPEELLRTWDQPIPLQVENEAAADDRFTKLVQEILNHSNHLHHPGYVGHQVAVPLPAAALFELVNALLNNGMAIYEMGQLQTVLERRVVEYLAETLGFGSQAGGVLTHGGSIGNFTALLSARQATAGHDVWTEGQQEPLSVLVSAQAHYCIARSVQAMGWGAAGAWPVPVDERFRMDVERLPQAYEEACAAGRKVIAVVASCCSTATGSFDPITAIADFCDERGLWLHVDGAHGASLAFSTKYRQRLKGVERAHSVVWDLHKMLGFPALNTAVLFREKRRAFEAFAQEASYLFEPTNPEEQWFHLGQATFECTKRPMGATAYGMFRMLGRSWFETQVDRLIRLTEYLHSQLVEAPDFEVACSPEANILCFRYKVEEEIEPENTDKLQVQLRAAAIASGKFYLVQTRLNDRVWLRVTLMNALTTEDDLDALIVFLRRTAELEAEAASG